MSQARLYLGIDAGGTSTRVVLQDPSGTIRKAAGPSAQLQRLGVEGSATILARVVEEVLKDEKDPMLTALVAGVAGAGDPEDQQALEASLTELLARYNPTHIQVVQDAEIALAGAFEGSSGLAIVAGTGSVLVARGKSGAYYKAGGWGYLLGDEGSGYALGLDGLRAVARALDGGAHTILCELLAEHFEVHNREDLIRRVYQTDWPLQEAAPLVLEACKQDDAVSQKLALDQTRALARHAQLLASQHNDIAPQFALLGGLTNDPFYHEALTTALHEVLPGWEEAPPRLTPVMGALMMARALEEPVPGNNLVQSG